MGKVTIIDGFGLTLKQAVAIGKGAPICLSSEARTRIDASERVVSKAATGKEPVYAVNTGYGYLANTKIGVKDLQTLQMNIIKSHASGYGTPLNEQETRLAQVLRLNVLAKGYTGVRWKLCRQLERHIAAGIQPIIPEYGSVGASGDLAPLAHLALPLLGLGMVRFQDEVISAREALRQTGLKAITLTTKEGLGLVNGTQIMCAVGSLALYSAIQLAILADTATALTMEGLVARTDPLDAEIHRLRGQPTQESSAREIRAALEESYLWQKKLKRKRVQDPYSIRCAPQVHGASRNMLAYSASVLEKELNAASDNPLVLPDEERMVSGGNFHGQPIALAMDAAAMAIAEIGSISERRIELCLTLTSVDFPLSLLATRAQIPDTWQRST